MVSQPVETRATPPKRGRTNSSVSFSERRSASPLPGGVDGDAGRDRKADAAAHFLLLDRAGNADCGVELGQILRLHANLVHLLPFHAFFDGWGAYVMKRLRLC